MTTSIAELRTAIEYDPVTGALTWGQGAYYNVKAGQRVGWSRDYVRLRFRGSNLTGHRVAWALHYGEWPEGQIDHINGNRLDNRISNLRLSTATQNQANARKRADSTTGLKGVAFRPGRRLPFIARIKVRGEQVWLGSYATAEEAHEAYCRAAEHTHGEFANAG